MPIHDAQAVRAETARRKASAADQVRRYGADRVIINIARSISSATADVQKPNTVDALVPWSLVHELRGALEVLDAEADR